MRKNKHFELYDLELNFLRNVDYVPNNFTGMTFFIKNKSKWWRKNYVAHRIGGPAKIWDESDPNYYEPQYYIDGKKVTKEYHDILFNMMKLKGLL